MNGLAFIDTQNNYLSYLPGATSGTLLQGKWTLGPGTAWSFDSTSIIVIGVSNIPIQGQLVGAGTLNTRDSYTGQYGVGSPATNPLSMAYSNANALAAVQADLGGQWGAGSLVLNISAGGTISGRFTNGAVGDCALNGAAVQPTPGTRKNMFAVSLVASGYLGAVCNLGAGPITGFAALTFANAGTTMAPSYQRTVTLLVQKSSPTAVIAAELTKQ